MKRILSITLIIATMVSLFTCAVYSSESVEFSKEVYILNKLGVFNYEIGEEIDYDKTVTRAECAAYIVRALDIPSVSSKEYFVDVPVDLLEAGAINALAEIGSINGTSSKYFNPYDNVSYGQVLKMMLASAGYKTVAEGMGDGVFGYERLANRLGVSVPTKNSEALTLRETAEVIYKCMRAEPVLKVNSMAVPQKGKTIFSEYRNVYFGKGTLEVYFGGSITGNAVNNKNEAIIGGEKYTVDDDIVIADYFGADIDFVCQKDDRDNYRVMYMEKKGEEIDVSSLFVKKYDRGTRKIEYYKDKESKRPVETMIPLGVSIVLNGVESQREFGDIVTEFVNGERKGSIRILKDTKGSVYRVIVLSYKCGVVKLYDAEKNILYIESDQNEEIDLHDYEHCILTNEFGVEKALSFSVNSLVMVAEAEDKSVVGIVSCTSVVEGEIGTARPDGKIIIGGKEYQVDKKYWKDHSGLFEAGNTIHAVLDITGEIAYAITTDGDSLVYGYLLDATIKYTGFGNSAIMKIYIPDEGIIEECKLADKVSVDGENYRNGDGCEILEAMPGITLTGKGTGTTVSSVERQLLKFEKNSDNQIKTLDTYKVGKNENSTNTLTRGYDGKSLLTYNASLGRFGMDAAYDATNTKLIFVPHTNADGDIIASDGSIISDSPDMYGCKIMLNSQWDYYIQSYYDNPDAYYASAIVVEVEFGRRDDTIFMIDHIEEVYENDEIKKSIVGASASGTVTFFIPEGFDYMVQDIEQGDIVRITVGVTGKEIATITKMYDCSDKKLTNSSGNPYWYANVPDKTGKTFINAMYQLSKSYAYSVKNGYLRSTYYMYDMDKGLYDDVFKISDAPVIVYDVSVNKSPIKKGSMSDIRSYETVGDSCSIILLSMNYQTMKQVFVYNY